MEQTDFVPDVRQEQAIVWITSPRERTGKTTVVELRQQFGLSPHEACEAINEAIKWKARAL